MSFEQKCVNFVNHIQEHLNKGDRGLKLYKLVDKPKEVGCAICGKTIDKINKKIDCTNCNSRFHCDIQKEYQWKGCKNGLWS